MSQAPSEREQYINAQRFGLSASSPHDYEHWIDKIWAFESTIDPARQSWYDANWNIPAVNYPKVFWPGRVWRDRITGQPIQETGLTIREYFDRLGIGRLYKPGMKTPPWSQMQACVLNYPGFIGFQFQESDLSDLGYYTLPVVSDGRTQYPVHYVDVPVSHWSGGVTWALVSDTKRVGQPTLVTDTVNFTSQNFTGRNGISSYEDLKDPVKHRLVIKDHFTNKYHGIVSGLRARGRTLEGFLGTSVTWNGLSPSVSPPPGGRANAVTITLSGLLAGAHLRGAQGVVSLLVDHQNPADENGTYILQYVQDFGGYQTPFTPGQPL